MDRKEERQRAADVAKARWAFEPAPGTFPGQAPMYQVIALTEEGQDVRTIALTAGVDAEENARRIAALPELLAALIALHRICCDCDLENEGDRPTEDQYVAAMDATDVAIAEVTGSAQ